MRLLTAKRQEALVLEEQLEQTQDKVDHLESSLDGYKQKYDACVEELGHVQDKYAQLQDSLSETRNRVRRLAKNMINKLIQWF